MAPRLALVTADELVDGELDGDELGPVDGDALPAVAELDDEVVFEDWVTDEGAAAVPPTLAHEARATAATATRPDLIKVRRAAARPCDISPFCQHE